MLYFKIIPQKIIFADNISQENFAKKN